MVNSHESDNNATYDEDNDDVDVNKNKPNEKSNDKHKHNKNNERSLQPKPKPKQKPKPVPQKAVNYTRYTERDAYDDIKTIICVYNIKNKEKKKQ